MENAPALEIGLILYNAEGQPVCGVVGLGEGDENKPDEHQITVLCGKTLREKFDAPEQE